MTARTGIALSARARNLILCAFLTFVALELAARLPARVLAIDLWNIVAVALLLAAACGQGLLVLRRMHVALSRCERLHFATALGLGLASVEIFLLGLAHLWSRPVLTVVLLAGGAAGIAAIRSVPAPEEGEPWSPPSWAPLFVVPHLVSFVAALAPPVYYDALVYHCGIPNYFLQIGHWESLPLNIYASFPQLMEMNFLLLVGSHAASGPCLLVWATSVMGVLAILLFARRFVSERIGWIAAGVVSVSPLWLLLGSDAYVDVPLAWISFLAVYAYFLLRDNPESRAMEILCGLIAGCAFGVKYTGGVTAALIFAGLLVLRRGTLFALTTAVVASPWLVRNLATTGNPVFPFLHQWMGASPWNREATAYYVKMLTEYGDAWSNLSRVLVIPWDLATESQRFGGGFDLLGNFGWGLPIVLLFFWLLLPSRRAAARPLFLLLLGYYLAWVATKPVSRFLLPAFPILALLAAWGVADWWQQVSDRWRIWSGAAIAVLLVGNAVTFTIIERTVGKFEAAATLEEAATFLARKLDYFNAARFVAVRFPGARVLVLGDQRVHYIGNPFEAIPVFATHPLIERLNAAATPAPALDWLHDRGIKALIVNDREWRRLLSYGTLALNDTGARNWSAIESSIARTEYADSACRVLAVE